MSARRILAVARRVMRQVLRDRRTLVLLVVVPMMVLALGAVLFRAEPPVIPLGVVNEDEGLALIPGQRLALGDRLIEQLGSNGAFEVVAVGRDEIDSLLRDGTLDGAVVLPADFSRHFYETRQGVVTLRLEGSNPGRSMTIAGRVTEASIRALAELVSSAASPLGAAGPAGDAAAPVILQTSYLYAGESYDTLDYVAPVYIAFLGMFFVFLLTCVSFLRERSQGTMERLLATPATRFEIILGYMTGLGLFALIQMGVILFFTVLALRIHYAGSLALLFLVVALLAIVGVSLGMLASAFARNEFQVVQFIPMVIIPQALLGGTAWAVEEMPGYLQPLAYVMPITYANRALRDVMLKGWGLGEIWPNLAALAAFAAVLIVLGALTMRREVA
jgi:ABC-2 type transport system permease protein